MTTRRRGWVFAAPRPQPLRVWGPHDSPPVNTAPPRRRHHSPPRSAGTTRNGNPKRPDRMLVEERRTARSLATTGDSRASCDGSRAENFGRVTKGPVSCGPPRRARVRWSGCTLDLQGCEPRSPHDVLAVDDRQEAQAILGGYGDARRGARREPEARPATRRSICGIAHWGNTMAVAQGSLARRHGGRLRNLSRYGE